MGKLSCMVILFFFISCVGGGGSGDSGNSKDSLVGSWYADCESFGGGYSGLTGISFSNDGKMEFIGKNYHSTNCDESTIQNIQIVEHTYEKNSSSFSATVKHHFATPKHADQVSDWNTNSLCGFNNWTLDITKDVVDVNCNDDLDEGDQTSNYQFDCAFTIVNGVLDVCDVGGYQYRKQ